MKSIAVLVIAATNQPVYIHYIENYWTDLIRYTNAETSNIDAFLLFEARTDIDRFSHLNDNVIQDKTSDFSQLCDPKFHTRSIPGILSKTIYAMELLKDDYDVFFRTNLSSIIKPRAFDRLVQNKSDLCYSGGMVWTDGLRDNLLAYEKIGPGKSAESLAALASYPGNTFVSGSGYFLSAAEVRSLIAIKHGLRYDMPDDVAVGLMCEKHESLSGFTTIVVPEDPIVRTRATILKPDVCHVRLQHFPIDRAELLWESLPGIETWD